MKNEQRQKDICNALMYRARLGKHHGWRYAMKWFSAWEKEYNKTNPLTH